MSGKRNKHNLFVRVKKHQIEMMQIRGKTIPEAELSFLKLNQLGSEQYYSSIFSNFSQSGKAGHPLNNVYYDPDGSNPLAVYYIQSPDGGTIKRDHLTKNFLDIIPAFSHQNIILITLNGVTSLPSIIKEYPAYNITVFDNTELIINPTKSFLSEKILGKLPDTQKQRLPQGMKPDQLVELCYDDPIVKFHGYVPGDVLRCLRRSAEENSMISEFEVKKIVTSNSIYIKVTNS